MKNLQHLFLQLRSEWFISEGYAHQLMPMLFNLLEGKAVHDRGELLLSAGNTGSFNAIAAYRGGMDDPFEEFPEGSVAIIPVRGVMIKYGTMCAWGADELTAILRAAYKSPKVDAIVLDIDSGGGSVAAIPVWLDALAGRNKPVVSLVDMCCSAAYYTAIHTDAIIAGNSMSALIGSIGVMVSWADFSQMYEKQGIKLHTVYADQSTHKNDLFKKANGEEGAEPDYAPLKKTLLNPLAISFQEAVKAARPQLKQDVEGILAGSVFMATDALENGLIDAIGTIDMAIEKAKELATLNETRNTLNQFLKS